MDKKELQTKLDEMEADMVFSLFMFLKNYQYLDEPDKIFKYIKGQWEYTRDRILRLM